MIPILLTPLVLATFAALTAAWLKRMPTRQFCPTCRHRAQTLVAPPWLRPASRWLALRWCADCGWSAVGRKGPEWIPGQQVAHDSGFHWGADVMRQDMGFEWRSQESEPAQPTPPDHPSGFRFAESGETEPEADHPSGFAWGKPDGVPPVERRNANHPSGFLWGQRPIDRAGSPAQRRQGRAGFFHWKKPGSDEPKAPGFHWGGAA